METLHERGLVRIAVLGAEKESTSLRDLFGKVAEEKGWVPDGDLEDSETGAMLLAAFWDGLLAGGIELRRENQEGRLPIHATWPELADIGCPASAELVLLALAREFRAAPGLLWTLCAEMWRFCKRRGITDLLVAVPVPNERIYGRLGWSLERVGEAREHWGEPCLPCRIDVRTVEQSVVRKAGKDPSLAWVVEQAHRP